MFLQQHVKRLSILSSIILVALGVNSCKKDNQNPLQTLLVGKWQLASVQVTYDTGSSTDSTVNIPVNCTQVFTFKADKTCTYSNFECETQPVANGQWSLTPNQLYLQTSVILKDSTAAVATPFKYAQIYNLGQFSLVLETGDIQPNYSLTAKRKIVQYGFINQNSLGASQ